MALTFSLKYLVNFCKASGLARRVKLCLSSEVPLLVEYGLDANSYLRFYLAPKVSGRIQSTDLRHANISRLGTRSEWHVTVDEMRYVFRDHVGARQRNVLICMRSESFGFILGCSDWRCCRRIQAFGASRTEGCTPPTSACRAAGQREKNQ